MSRPSQVALAAAARARPPAAMPWQGLASASLIWTCLVAALALVVRAWPSFSESSAAWVVVALMAGALVSAAAAAYGVVRERRRLQARVAAMREAALQLGGGDLDAAVPEGDDDLGALGTSLNVMSARLARVLRAQRDLLSGVSHELRSPLTRIGVAVELIEAQQASENNEMAELLAGIREEVALLERHIARLLEAQRVSSRRVLLARKPLLLDALVTRVVARERLRLQQLGWNVEVQLALGPVEILADDNALDRVVSTLIENAVQHGSPPADGAAPSLAITTHAAGEFAIVTVADRGPGLTPEQCAVAFEPFARIDSSRSSHTGGTGLGLYLTRTICEAHGGHATAQPRQGGGLQVELRLPTRERKGGQETMRVALGEDGADARGAAPPPGAERRHGGDRRQGA